MTRISLCALAALAAAGCSDKSKPADPMGPEPSGPAATGDGGATAVPGPPAGNNFAVPATWPAVASTAADDRTADGIPVMEVSPGGAGRQGDVTWISDVWTTLQIPTATASDGARILFATRGLSSDFSDVLIRDGHIFTNVLTSLASSPTHPGGCAAANGGDVVLSAPAVAGNRGGGQKAWLLHADGSIDEHALPATAGAEDRCTAWLDDDGVFTIGTFGLATFDGTAFAVDRDWYPGRTQMASARGKRYCFRSCNQAEKSATDYTDATAMEKALGCRPEYTVYDRWLVGDCRADGKVGRMELGGGPIETIDQVPQGKTSGRVALTTGGDVVIGLDYGMRSYAVWTAGAAALSPVRTLADDEILAASSPTLLVRGLPPRVPEGVLPATVLGDKIAFGAGGSTVASHELRRGDEARKKQVERAVAVLPRADNLTVAYEAVVDMDCGAYVRSPAGWEGEAIEDWVPPALPALSAKAVYDPPECLPLAEVFATPGVTDLLLAKTRDGKLAVAWLPPPLPLPAGYDARTGPSNAPPPVQNPVPGSGWTVLDTVTSIQGIPGLPPPGAHVPIARDSWLAGGAAIVTVGDEQLLVTHTGTFTVPATARPMAMLQYESGVFGAMGHELLACDDNGCRVLDPGVGADIVAVVPRKGRDMVLGYAGGAMGLYTWPTTGGRDLPAHPLAATIDAVIAARPR